MSEKFEIEVKTRIGESNNVYGIHATKNGRLIGHAYGQINPDSTAVLESINIDTSERGKGIGTALLSKFIECMLNEGVSEITGEMKTEYSLHIEETKRFYNKNGFEVDENSNLRKRLL